MFRGNMARTFGNFVWVSVPLVAALLLLPHEVDMNLFAVLLPLLGVLVVNTVTLVLPYRESALRRSLAPLVFLLLLADLSLLAASISLSGGARSPLFPLLLLVTAFGCGLLSSPGLSAVLVTLSLAAHLSASTLFHRASAGETQLICSQAFFLIFVSLLFERLSAEARRQHRERSRSMEELRKLADMNRAASGFVSAVSFEMRTPLTSLQGFSEMLVSKPLDHKTEMEYLSIIRREAENLGRLVEDLLDVSRLESGKVPLQREAYPLEELVRAALPALEHACDQREVVCAFPPGLPRVTVDVKRMSRAINGMFDFISRRFGSGSEVRVSMKAEGEELVYTVNVRNRQATFLGENPKLHPMAHWDASEGDLDLAIARRIIAAHGGLFSVIRASGGWLTMVTRLPLAPGSEGQEARSATPPTAGEGG
ncbi:histidine kinase dimerization/phospho-acceptor domain-containing protein [Candidatus Solincola tengchongensis]|uniref:sensor histidine kinase n=1 Tax=Candidatus Solincola tengchongensis TaxID=2900693 RepID=UPI00257B7F7A|nr:histidine kinase dimerization/phospho-acceptor domain-containing protein [Candidatus Solincola tengchongensis]